MYNAEHQKVNGGGKKRNQSIELLRIVMMTLIVFGHFLLYGYWGTDEADRGLNMQKLLLPLYVYHVDAFVFVSGYYGINLRWSKFAMLIIKMVVYSIVAIGLAMIVMSEFNLTLSSFLHNVYPISACDWWFMSQYLFLMLLAPIINKGVDALDKKTLTILVIVLYLSWFRCTSVLLLFIYILGRYLRKYPYKPLEQNAGKIFVGTVALSFVVNYFLIEKGIELKKLYDYMSPFAVIPAVAIFYIFMRWNLQWKGIGFVASGVLAAYLITSHELPRQAFNDYFFGLVHGNAIALLGISLLVVLVCSLVDRIAFQWIK